MYPLGLRILRTNATMFTALTVAIVILEASFSNKGIPSLLGFGLVMLLSFRMILLGELYSWKQTGSGNFADGKNLPYFGFLFRYLGFFIVACLVFVAGLIAVDTSGLGNLTPSAVTSTVAYLLSALAFAAVMALLGNVLATASLKETTSIQDVLSLGKKHFSQTFRNLMVGPFAIAFIGIIVFESATWISASFFEPSPLANWVLTAIAVIFSIFAALMLATALSLSVSDRDTP